MSEQWPDACACHCGERMAELQAAASDLLFHLGLVERDPETEQAKEFLAVLLRRDDEEPQ